MIRILQRLTEISKQLTRKKKYRHERISKKKWGVGRKICTLRDTKKKVG